MSALLKKSDTTSVVVTNSSRPAFFDPTPIPWTDWVMDGTWFKLMNVNPITGGFSMILKVNGNNTAPVHGHIGAFEGIILEGGFGYGDDRGRPGWYAYEGAGIVHQPDSDPDGFTMFAVLHGGIAGYHDDGSCAALVDAKLMWDMAAANNAVSHLVKPLDW
jgi:hypothetical protein